MDFKILKYIILCFITHAIFAGEMEINSSPDKAQIYIRGPKSGERKLLGVTPYKGNFESVARSLNIDNDFIVEIEKEGYHPYNLLVAKINKTDIKFLTTLKAVQSNSKNDKIDNIILKLFDAQRFVRSKAYDEAVKVLDKIEEDAGNLSSFYEIKGGTLYLRKDFNGALANYRKAISLNENNQDALTMKNYLENVLGEKKN